MSGAEGKNQQVFLVRRPVGDLAPGDFELRQSPVLQPGEGEVLIRNIYLSLDPAQRLWAKEEDTYIPRVELGEVMRGFTMGEVIRSRNPSFPEGSIVTGVLGWEAFSISDGLGGDYLTIVDLPDGVPLVAEFTLYSHIGLTSYFGMLDVLDVQEGQDVVVSAAAGAVGSVAVQIAKIRGCRVVGIAGTDEKCRWITQELGADAAINYRSQSLPEALAQTCPDGVDRFFDNVGGRTLEAAIEHLKLKARIAMVGFISQYGVDGDPYVPRNLYKLLDKRARLESFVVFDYAEDPVRWRQAHDDIGRWYLEGRLTYRVDIVEGLENGPVAVRTLFDGTNTGKLLVKLAEEPARPGEQVSSAA